MMELHRHPCGLFYSRQFAEYLRQKQAEEEAAHPGKLMALEYVRCREGDQAGAAWWRLSWVPLISTPTESCQLIGETEVIIPRQTQRGLTNRLLHFEEGQVVVKN